MPAASTDTPGTSSDSLASSPPRSSRRALLITALVVALAVVAAGLLAGSVVIVVLGLLGSLAVCAVGAYTDSWQWTGIGPASRLKREDEDFQPGKTLWDALQIVIVPVIVAYGVWWLNDRQTAANRINADKQATVNAINAQNQARDVVLDTYLDRISDLMKQGLNRQTPPGWQVEVAGARTVTALRRLDGTRNAFLTQFLQLAQLFPVISLSFADLSHVDLSQANLQDTRLTGSDLRYAHLTGALLSHAGLWGADLRYAQLSYAHLAGAVLLQAYLSHAGLSHADLSHADLSEANLSYANLSHANLSHADLSHARLSGVIWDHTRCPDLTNSADTPSHSCVGHLNPGP